MDFDVNTPVTVTQLGAFDFGGDGFAGTLIVGIFNRDTQVLNGSSLTFTHDDPGTLVGGSRFKTPGSAYTLPAGFHGAIVEWWNNGADRNGNRTVGDSGMSFNNLGGALTLVEHANFGGWAAFPSVFPDSFFSFNGSAPVWAAGTFAASTAPVPEPSTYLAGALLLPPFELQGIRRLRNRKHAA